MEQQENTLDELVSICTQKYNEKAKLETEIKKLVPQIFIKMKEQNRDKVVSPFGKYTTSFSTKYEYSEATEKLAAELVMAQEREKAEKIAKVIKTPNIKFGKLTKDEEEF